LEAKIAKERGKRVERTVGYDNDEDALRREFGSDTELDELETAGGRADSGRHSQREPQREHGANPGALVGAAQFREPRDTESQVEETDREDRENGFITTR
jgi:hypothetical protein